MPAAQKCQQRQQWQTENGEVVAFDMLEQMNSEPFDLIGADGGRNRITSRFEIVLDFGIAKRTHGHAGYRNMLEQQFAVASHRNRRMKLMAMTGKCAQLIGSLCPARGLVENTRSQRKRLVGADDIPRWPTDRHGYGFLARKQFSNI